MSSTQQVLIPAATALRSIAVEPVGEDDGMRPLGSAAPAHSATAGDGSPVETLVIASEHLFQHALRTCIPCR